ncbi:hypothetical protein KKD37_02070 [Patescibacteria group bacterium]|nr:hypothetical protein [Patescibacteria group bacterium]
MKKYLPIFFSIIFVFIYLFPRLKNITENIQFRYDQGFQLIEVKEMVDSRQPKFIGPSSSISVNGRQFFTGAIYYYVLAILGSFLSWSPLSITIALIIIELFFYLVFVNFLYKHYGHFTAIISSILISFSPYLIYHSFFFWNPHFLIPLSIIFLVFRKNPYISAFAWGLAFSFHYSAIFWLLPYLYFRVKNKQLNLKTIIFSVVLFLIANFPFLIFELRHQFYNLKTIFLVLTSSSNSFQTTPHYFIFSLLIFTIYFFIKISQKINFPVYLLLLFFLFFKESAVTKQALELSYPEQNEIAKQIASTCPESYNIAVTNQGDTRAYNLRYLLSQRHCLPMDVESYPQAKTLFLVASSNSSPENETVWEVSTFKPFKIAQQQIINDNVIFYRLEK